MPRFGSASLGIELQQGGAIATTLGNSSEIRWGAAFTRDVLGTGVHGACFTVKKGLYIYVGLARSVSHVCCEFGSYEPRPQKLLTCATLQGMTTSSIANLRHATFFWGLEIRTGWVSQGGMTRDWSQRQGFKPGDKLGLVYGTSTGSLALFCDGRPLGTVANGLPGPGMLVWTVSLMGRHPGYDKDGQEVLLEAWDPASTCSQTLDSKEGRVEDLKGNVTVGT